MFAGPDAHGVFDADDEDLAVAHLAGTGGRRQLVDHRRDDLSLHDGFDLEPRPQGDVDGGSTVFLGVAALGAAALDLGDGHT
jgi:hypothetical protein